MLFCHQLTKFSMIIVIVSSDEVSDVDLNGNEECDNDTAASPNQLFVIPAVAVEYNIMEKLILTAEERGSLEPCTR